MPLAPIDKALDIFERAQEFVLDYKNPRANRGARRDLLRMAIVMGVSALDTYMHARILKSIDTDSSDTGALARLDIPFEEIAELAQNTKVAQREGTRSRPWVHVKNALQRRLLRETFQSYEDVGKGLAMCGVEQPWKKVAETMDTTAPDIRDELRRIVNRRNQIVHEGDQKRLVRPQRVTHNQVARTETLSDLRWLKELVTAIDGIQ